MCLLSSFLNPAHEQRVEEIVREEFPDAFLSVSSEVLPQYREYERFSTVALNAYVGPKVSRLRARASTRRCAADGVEHRAAADESAERRGHGRGRVAAAGEPAHVRPGRRAGRRHLGRAPGGLRQRHHARRRRDLGRHRRRSGRAAADAAPARHERRRLPGDDPDGRRRHDRRRRRLDRLRRRAAALPRRAAIGGRRPRTGLLRRAAARSRRPPTPVLLGWLRPEGALGRRHGPRARARATAPSRRWPSGSG